MVVDKVRAGRALPGSTTPWLNPALEVRIVSKLGEGLGSANMTAASVFSARPLCPRIDAATLTSPARRFCAHLRLQNFPRY